MAVVRGSLLSHMERTGQPLIHEYLHALGLYHDRKHEDLTVWERRDDVVQVEEKAESLYRSVRPGA